MKRSKAIITGMLIPLVVVLFLIAANRLNKDSDQQQRMEEGILQNPARDILEDSVQLQQREAAKMANYIREWKEFEKQFRERFVEVSTH